jgi:hypothetical protein
VLNPYAISDNLSLSVSEAANVFIADSTVANCEVLKAADQYNVYGCANSP